MLHPGPLPDQSVRTQVRRITESALFSRSDRLKQFLDFVTERTLAGRAAELKESVLALEVFGRDGVRDDGADSVVRVTASKVRSKLKEYYHTEGAADTILIELPTGTYAPVFHGRKGRPGALRSSSWTAAAVGALAVLALGAFSAWVKRRPGEQAPHKTDPAVYEMYAQADHYAKQFTAAGRLKSFDLFREVIRRDPRFVPAYVTLAQTHLNPPQLRPPWEEASEARVLLAKALELDAESQDALVAMGVLKYQYDWDWRLAEKYFRRAIGVDPKRDAPHQRLGEFLGYAGRTDESIDELQRGLKADPVSDRTLAMVALANYLGRRFDQAVESANRIIEIHPASRRGYLCVGVIQAGAGHAAEAIAALERLQTIHDDPATSGHLGALGHAYAIAGRRRDAERMLARLQELSKTQWVSPLFPARVYVGLGMKKKALDLIEQALDQHDPSVTWLGHDARMDPIRGEARYQAVLKRLQF